jgi:glutathione peroxidase
MNIRPQAIHSDKSLPILSILGFLLCLLSGATLGVSTADAATETAAASCPAIWQKSFNKLQDDTPQSLCQYAGKVVLVVNTASYCGFTAQYEGLEKLYAQYKDRGFVVLGFPSNDFGKQEPGTSKEIADFCFNTYGVVFPMFSKSTFTGPDANPLFAELTKVTDSRPRWNFHKYLVGRDGNVVAAYPSVVAPGDKKLVSEIERLLGAR